MKKQPILKKRLFIIFIVITMAITFTACDYSGKESYEQSITQLDVQDTLIENQPMPTDINFSLERYNLIRRAYWVNGQQEKSRQVECPVEKPLGYVILFSEHFIYGQYTVDGKVSSLNSYLSADTTYPNSTSSNWLADVDGSYGTNDNGIFFFTVDGHYHEWSGNYKYSDTYENLDNSVIPVLHTELDYKGE